MEETKICKRCGREKSIEEFYKARQNKDGRMNERKECSQEKDRLRSAKGETENPEFAKFTPKQLIEELKARGYKGELRYEHVIKV